MSHISEKEIITAIKAKRYSALTFLEEYRDSSENKWYLGFYYFIQDLKKENTQTTFKEIISKYGNESSAYSYLGDTASKIYSEILHEHIPTCFYKKSVELDNGNIDAHWGLYNKDHNMNAYLKVLEFHYEGGKFEVVINIINGLYVTFDSMKELSLEQWAIIKKIVMDKEVSCDLNLLILAHFHLDEIDEGLALINSMDRISYDIIQPYAEKGLVDKEKVISNIYSFQVHNFCSDDYKSIYQKYLKEASVTREVIIKFAFQAEEFHDVITHYGEAPKDDILFKHSVSARIYYLLAKLQLNEVPDEKILQFIRKKSDSLRNENITLYKVLKLKLKLKELNKNFNEGQASKYTINHIQLYSEAKDIIDSSVLMTYFQYAKLKEELKAIKDEWNKSYYQHEFEKIKNEKSSLTLQGEGFLKFYNLAIEVEAYDYAIDKIIEYHKSNVPTMPSHNILGVCYERKGQLPLAFEQYKYALNLMLSSKEKDHVIIGNYIAAATKLPNVDISEEDFLELKQIFNIAITNLFQWHTFTAKGGNRLFKYSYLNLNTLDALTNQYFYLSSREQLNDPIELPRLDKVGEGQLIDSNYRTFSLSHNINSMLMWSHYAEQHQGIMIEYCFGGELPEGVGIENISYSEELKRNEEKDLFIFNQFLLTKNKGWEYEREVRLFSNNTNKIYFEKFDYPNHDRNRINAEIISITLGCKFPENKKELITNIITKINNDKRKSEQKISLKEAYISEDDKFAIKYREIDL